MTMPSKPAVSARSAMRPAMPGNEMPVVHNSMAGGLAQTERDLVGEEAPFVGERDPSVVHVDQLLDVVGQWQRAGRYADACAQSELQTLDPPAVVIEHLLTGDRRRARLDGVDVAIGCAHVPPTAAGTVRVRGTTEAFVVALGPVEKVVATLVT